MPKIRTKESIIVYMSNRELYTETHCEICGEVFRATDQLAEMYDPDSDAASVICHAQCGLSRNYEVA
jgi:hypothetical protein